MSPVDSAKAASAPSSQEQSGESPIAGSRLRQDAQESPADFVYRDECTAPALLLHVTLDFVELGRGGTAGLEQPHERLVGAHRHPLGNKGLAISGEAVDARPPWSPAARSTRTGQVMSGSLDQACDPSASA